MRETRPDADTDRLLEAVVGAGVEAARERIAADPSWPTPALAAALRARSHGSMRADPAAARATAEIALLVAEAARDPRELLAARAARAQASLLLGLHREAFADLETARAALAQDEEPRELAVLRVQALLHTGAVPEARRLCDALLARVRREGDRKHETWARMTLADLEFRADRPRAALAQYQSVERLLPDDARPALRAALCSNRANALAAVNRFRAAARHFELASRLFAEAGAAHGTAQVAYNAAYVDGLRGRYADALAGYARSEAAFQAFGDARHLAHADLDRAEIHLHLSLPEDARRYAARAEEGFRALSLTKEEAQAALWGGRAAQAAGRFEDAEVAYARAGELFAAQGLDERRFSCLVHRASLARHRGDRATAWALVAEAERSVPATANPLSAMSLDLLRGRLALAEGDAAEATLRATSVLRRSRRVHAPWVRMDAHWIAGRAAAVSDRVSEAVVHYERAIDELEAYRGGVPPDEYMTAFLAGRSALYQEIVELLVRTGEVDLAFAFAERAKARALVDLLAGRSTPSPEGAAEKGGARVRALRERLAAIYHRLGAPPEGGATRAARSHREARLEARRLESEVGRLLRERALTEPRLAALEGTTVCDLTGVQRDLPADTVLLEYFLTAESIVIFVVTRGTARVVRVPAAADALRQALQRFRFHLSKFDGGDDAGSDHRVLAATRANLARIAAMVLAPVLDDLGGDRVVVVPHGVLHHVPFHALPLGDGWVSDRFEVVYAPSAAVYARMGHGRAPAHGPSFVMGVPDAAAPQIGAEALHVGARLEDARVVLGEDATFARLREAARTARVIHIATHGMFCAERPMLSAIRLADRWMNLYDLYDLDVRSALVVLSTCESGTAHVSGGDEILGLTRGFLVAGAGALLTTQWRVHDDATREWMEAFYAAYATDGDAARATRHAMATVRARRPHPYYWAPFFLTGRPTAADVRMPPPETEFFKAPLAGARS